MTAVRRRLAAAVLTITVLSALAGCGAEGTTEALDATADSPADTASGTTGMTDSPSGGSATTGSAEAGPGLGDLPLAAGLKNQDGSPATSTPDGRGVLLPAGSCFAAAWSGTGPSTEAIDRRAVEVTGPDYREAREVQVFTDADTAVSVVRALRDGVAQCPDLSAENADNDARLEVVDVDTGDESLTFTMSYATGLGGGIWQFSRVGRAVLATSAEGEYAPESVAGGVPDQSADSAVLLADLCGFTAIDC